MSYWIQSGVYKLLERSSQLFFGLLSFFILVRIFDKVSFGTWTLYMSVTTAIELIKNGFIKNSMIKYLAEAESEEKVKIKSASFLLNVGVTVFVSVVLALIAFPLSNFWDAPLLSDLLFIYIIIGFVKIFLFHIEFVQYSNLVFKGPFWGSFVSKGFFFGVVLTGYLFNLDLSLNILAFVQIGTAFLGTLASFYFVRRFMEFRFVLDKKWIMRLFHFGKFTFGSVINAQILKNIDNWMLGAIINPAAVAIYNPAIRISNLYDIPSVTLANVLFPQAVKQIKREGSSAAKRLYEKSSAYIVGIMLPVVILVLIFAEELVIFVAGTEYLEAVPVLRITMLYGIIAPFNRQFGVILDAMGKVRTNLLYVLTNSIINIVLNYFFIHKFGILGAALATLSTFIIAMIIAQVWLVKNLKVNVKSYPYYMLEVFRMLFKKGLDLFNGSK